MCVLCANRRDLVSLRFIDLTNGYYKVNREAWWQVLRIYDVYEKLLNGIQNMHVKSSLCNGKMG